MKISSLTFLSFIWLRKTFKILLPTKRSLLQTEIDNRKSHLRTLQNEFNRLCNKLQFKLNCIDFAHISALFLSSNDNLLKIHDSIQQKKFNKLLIENGPKQDPEKVIFNFSKLSVTDAEKTLLVKGLSFVLPPKQLSYSDYLILNYFIEALII